VPKPPVARKKRAKSAKPEGIRKAKDRADEKALIEALKGSGGILSKVAQKLGVSWHTVEKRIAKNPAALEAFNAEREFLKDMAESTIVKAISQGDVGAARWVLSTLGRSRGYGEKVEVTHTEIPAIIIETYGEK
jgi:hypothetical protein